MNGNPAQLRAGRSGLWKMRPLRSGKSRKKKRDRASFPAGPWPDEANPPSTFSGPLPEPNDAVYFEASGEEKRAASGFN